MDKRPPKFLQFVGRVFRDFFMRNHGLLLTSAVAYNMMLSLIPLSAVFIVILSNFFCQDLLMETITTEVSLIAPGFTPILTEVLTGFLKTRQLIGWLGLGSLLLFSSLAFRVMEDAMAIIFHRPIPALKRKFWVSALMPYLFILIISGGLIAITTMNALIDALEFKNQMIFGFEVTFYEHLNKIFYITGVLGLFLLFSLFYKLMPTVRVSFRRALAGGFTATILWEIVRHLLVSYYSTVSMVNFLYGSMATIIIVLLTMESVALILLIGAQVISNLQRASEAGISWYEDPDQPIKS